MLCEFLLQKSVYVFNICLSTYICVHVYSKSKEETMNLKKSRGEVLEELESCGGAKLYKYKILKFQIGIRVIK